MNRAVRVEGRPTNQRAELMAFLLCITGDRRALHVRTDSRYVQLGVKSGMARWKGEAWMKRATRAQLIDHVDLWRKVDRELGRRETEVAVTWVKGHAMPWHVKEGRTTERDVYGNNRADEEADRGTRQEREGAAAATRRR